MPDREPHPSREQAGGPDPKLTEETEAAAAEAAAIGGQAGEKEETDPAQAPLREAGQGVSEGFEESERELVESASHGDSRGFPDEDIPEPEEPTQSSFGEGDSASPPDGPEDEAEPAA